MAHLYHKATTDLDRVAIGRRLAELRERLSLTQDAFAETLGVSRRAYVNYERGEREIPVGLVKALYDTYHVDFMWLLTGVASQDLTPIEDGADVGMIVEVIQELDRQLDEADLVMRPDDKVRVIKALYHWSKDRGNVDPASVASLLQIAVGQ